MLPWYVLRCAYLIPIDIERIKNIIQIYVRINIRICDWYAVTD